MADGALYHCNGRLAARQFKVEVSAPGQEWNIVSDGKGQFALPQIDHWPKGASVRVNGNKIKPQRLMVQGSRLIVIMPEILGAPDNDGGGVITGRVYLNDAPYPEAKVEAQVVSTSIFGAINPQAAVTKTDRKGRFALEVVGGLEVKNLFAGGKSPQEMRVKGQPEPFEERLIPVGTFGLQIKASSKFLGLF
jgi:hypothetical protein